MGSGGELRLSERQMTLKHKFRRLVQKRLGLDIIRYPGHDLLARTVQMLQYHEVNVVVDVGANDGAFAASIREVGYAGRIISFEPVSTPFFSALSKRAAHDSKWDVYRCVIGANKGRATINIAGNAALSSSVLPMLDAHIAAGPDTRYIGTETVDQDCLDSILPRIGGVSATIGLSSSWTCRGGMKQKFWMAHQTSSPARA